MVAGLRNQKLFCSNEAEYPATIRTDKEGRIAWLSRKRVQVQIQSLPLKELLLATRSPKRDFVSPCLFLLKMIAEVIDPVTGTVQLGCFKRQIRSVEATNIRMMNLILIIYPSIRRL
jgi:hypothetical protein